MPSSSTNTSPCSIGFRVPASMFKYGSAFIVVTLKPRDLRRRAIEEVAMPLPIPDMTPPDTKTTLVFAIKNPSLLILAGGALPCRVPDGTGYDLLHSFELNVARLYFRKFEAKNQCST